MTGETEVIRRTLNRVSEERIRAHILALQGPRHPVSAPEALERAADYIRDNLHNLGYDIWEQRFPAQGKEFRNVIASCQGVSLPKERIMVVAHYDTVEGSPGADDNASGVAVMLELARVLRQLSFRRSVQFVGVGLEENGCCEGEDEGRRGSRALASHAEENGWGIEGVVVLESVAYAGDRCLQRAPADLPVEVPATGDFIAVVGNEESREMAESFAVSVEHYGIPLPCRTLIVPGKGEMLPDSRRSDHASFWDVGYRAIMVTDTTNFRSPHYHQPTDTLDTLNIPFAARVCRACCALVAKMATLSPQPTAEEIPHL